MREYLITLVFFGVFCLAVVTIRQQAEGIQFGYRISATRHRLERLRDSNDRLRLAVLRLRSPGRIMQRARQMELKEPTPESFVPAVMRDGRGWPDARLFARTEPARAGGR